MPGLPSISLDTNAIHGTRHRLLRWARLLTLGLGVLGLSACEDYPRDPNRTLQKVLARGALRVVAVDHQPWVDAAAGGQTPRGAEVDLVEAFAQDLGVVVEWHRAPAFEAFEALERGDADLAIGGFTATAVEAHPGGAHTYPYFTEKLIIAALPGAPVPQHIEGERVLVSPDLMADSLVEEEDGIPVSEPGTHVHLVLLPQWQIPESGLVPTPVELRTDEYVMAVPPGENAWLMQLERFLREEAGDVGARLREHAS